MASLSGVTFERLSNLRTRELRNQAYSTFSDKERLNLWHTKLSYEMNSGGHSKEKVQKIQELKDYLNLKIFQKSDEREIFSRVWLPNWIKNSSAIFTDEEIGVLVFSFEKLSSPRSTKKANQSLTSFGGESEGSCKCAVGSNFTCPTYYFVGTQMVVRWGDCTKSGTCISSVRGCGALVDDACDGNVCT